MSRPKSTGEIKDKRLVLMIAPSELAAIDDWMFAHRLRSRAEAVRQMCAMAITEAVSEPKASAA